MGIFQQEINFPRFQFLSGFKQTVAARKFFFLPSLTFQKSGYFYMTKRHGKAEILAFIHEILVPIHTLALLLSLCWLKWKRDLALKKKCHNQIYCNVYWGISSRSVSVTSHYFPCSFFFFFLGICSSCTSKKILHA